MTAHTPDTNELGWQRAEEARKDRAAALNQWKAARLLIDELATALEAMVNAYPVRNSEAFYDSPLRQARREALAKARAALAKVKETP